MYMYVDDKERAFKFCSIPNWSAQASGSNSILYKATRSVCISCGYTGIGEGSGCGLMILSVYDTCTCMLLPQKSLG